MPSQQFAPIDFWILSYLCFEGGGGKGIGYLSVIQALEEKLNADTYDHGTLGTALLDAYPDGGPFSIMPLGIKASERKF